MTLTLTEEEVDSLKEIVETWVGEGFVSKLTEEQKSIIEKLGIEM